MRTRTSLVALLLTATLVVSTVPAAAQGRRGHGGSGRSSHVGAGLAIGLVVGALFGARVDPLYAGYDAQWYPPYGYPRSPNYPPYRYRMMDRSADVRVQVEPASAEVFVDGYFAGHVDDFDGFFQRLYLAPGPHEIVVFKDGYRSLVRRMYFAPNVNLRIKDRLEPLGPNEPRAQRPMPADDPDGMRDAPAEPVGPPPARDDWAPREAQEPRRAATADTATGQVSVRVQPLDADVVVDGELWQRAQGLDRLTVTLPVGTHRIDVRKPGFVPFSSDVTVKPGETVSLNVSLSERQ
jgi:hypothetical protein